MNDTAVSLACPAPTADLFALRRMPSPVPVRHATARDLRSVLETLKVVEADLPLQLELRAAPAVAELVGGPGALPRVEARIQTLYRARAELTAWLRAYRVRQVSLDAPRRPIARAPLTRPRAFRRAKRRVASTSNTSARGPDDEPPAPARGAILRAQGPMLKRDPRDLRGGRRDG